MKRRKKQLAQLFPPVTCSQPKSELFKGGEDRRTTTVPTDPSSPATERLRTRLLSSPPQTPPLLFVFHPFRFLPISSSGQAYIRPTFSLLIIPSWFSSISLSSKLECFSASPHPFLVSAIGFSLLHQDILLKMSCFGFLKSRSGKPAQHRSAPAEFPTSGTNESAPAAFPTNGTSQSDDSAAGKQTSKSSGSTSSQRSIPAMYEERAHNLRVFQFVELMGATNDFSRTAKIGQGGFGSVYKGFIKPDGNGKGDRIPVAVKKLNTNGMQGHKQWLAEVQFLGVVEHPNLVKLIGYCAEDGERSIQRLLVYEFMPNKSLEDHLFSRAYPSLSWNLRLQIALGVAEGLVYLHEGLEVQVIYRDFKASNILLDQEFRPKLSDFGLAREGPTDGRSHVSTAVVGTYGYAAPDYIETGHLTVRSDVWSFGVVLYEILTGRRSLERNRPKDEQKLLVWVKQYPADSRRFSMIMDPRLRDQFSLKAAREIAKLADHCLAKNARERPSMSEVVKSLKKAIQFSETV